MFNSGGGLHHEGYNQTGMRAFDNLLEQPLLFNISQIPFKRQKFERILKHDNLMNVRNALDVGCGAGSNTSHFAHTGYLGIDINERYIRVARRRYEREFLVADVTSSRNQIPGSYDFILLNSFLHHIDTPAVLEILGRLRNLLAPGGHVHSIELVLPEKKGLPHRLALLDRGKFPRSLSCWRELFEFNLETVIFEPFGIHLMGKTIMELVYFKGRVKR